MTKKNYKVNIRETMTDESFTFWIDRLNLDTWKAIKKELLEQVEKYETEHELTLTEQTESKSHFLGWDERIITKIKTGASMFERKNRFLFDL